MLGLARQHPFVKGSSDIFHRKNDAVIGSSGTSLTLLSGEAPESPLPPAFCCKVTHRIPYVNEAFKRSRNLYRHRRSVRYRVMAICSRHVVVNTTFVC